MAIVGEGRAELAGSEWIGVRSSSMSKRASTASVTAEGATLEPWFQLSMVVLHQLTIISQWWL